MESVEKSNLLKKKIDDLRENCESFARRLQVVVYEVQDQEPYSDLVVRSTISGREISRGAGKSPYVFLTGDDEGRAQALEAMLAALIFADSVHRELDWERWSSPNA